MAQNEKVDNEIQNVLDSFTNPDSLDLIAKAMFKRGKEIPSDKWSLLNRIIMLSHGSIDARGPKAWLKVNRRPQKGGYFFILGPKMITLKDSEGNIVRDADGKPEMRPIGFKPIMVWPVEKTSGDEVDYGVEEELPAFFCEEVAKEWGIDIRQGFENPSFYAYFSESKKEIVMATPSQQTFFHELAHVADSKISKGLKNGQDTTQEIVAEFSSVVLMKMFGLDAGTKSAYNYIESYANKIGKDPVRAVAPLLGRIDKVVKLILETNKSVTGMEVG